jgi:ketosteroid isomerase-like protein
MSRENVEIVRKLYEVQNDFERFLQLLDPDVVWINDDSVMESRPYVGHEGVREWVRELLAGFSDLRFEVTEIIDAGGDQVIAFQRVLGTGIKSGVQIDREVSTLLTLVNGKIVRLQGFATRPEALEAAGLSE